MVISLTEKCKPFTHLPGTHVVLPGTELAFKIFPAKVITYHLTTFAPVAEIALSITGPVKNFTVQLDLDRGYIEVWGNSFRYRIIAIDGDFKIVVVKEPSTGLFSSKERLLANHQKKELPIERLHLGVTKKQEWCLVHRRSDLKEILPFWYALSQQVPFYTCENKSSLHQEFLSLLKRGNIVEIGPKLVDLYLAGFEGVLVPHFEDRLFQGYPLAPFYGPSPLSLLSGMKESIRSLFIQEEGERISMLPVLPTEFPCGRMMNVQLDECGDLDLEWSKKRIRRIHFRVNKNCRRTFSFQKDLKSFRFGIVKGEKGARVSCGSTLSFEAGKSYLFDNFHK